MKGFRVLSTKTSTIKRFSVDTGVAVPIGRGDLVALQGDTNVTDSFPLVNVLAAYDTSFLGAVVSIYNSAGAEVTYLPASTAGFVDVETDPLAEYVCTTAADATALTSGAIGACADPVFVSCGVDGNGLNTLSETTGTSGKQFRIVDLYRAPSNAWGSHGIQVIVRPAVHMYLSTPNGI